MKCLEVEPSAITKLFKEIEILLINLNESLKFQAMLICEEIITNQIRHTNFGKNTPDITVCLDLENKKSIVIVFKDNAEEFNPLQKEEPNIIKSLEDTKLGGLGIFIVKKYSRKLKYEYKNGYNILKVTL